ncbi:hypothetical protein ACYQOP_27245 [Methylobacterium sp. CM6247]
MISSEDKSNYELQGIYASHVYLGLAGEGARFDPLSSFIGR